MKMEDFNQLFNKLSQFKNGIQVKMEGNVICNFFIQDLNFNLENESLLLCDDNTYIKITIKKIFNIILIDEKIEILLDENIKITITSL